LKKTGGGTTHSHVTQQVTSNQSALCEMRREKPQRKERKTRLGGKKQITPTLKINEIEPPGAGH